MLVHLNKELKVSARRKKKKPYLCSRFCKGEISTEMQSLPHLGLTLGSIGLFCSLVQGVVGSGHTEGILTDPGCVFDRLWFTVSLELEFDGISNSFIALPTE